MLLGSLMAGAIVAATVAMMAAEQRSVRAGIRAGHRPDEVRRELGRILRVQRQRLREHSRLDALSQAEHPACWLGPASLQQQQASSCTTGT